MEKLFESPGWLFVAILFSMCLCPPLMIWLVISLDAYEQEKAKADKLVREERDKAFEELREMEELVDMAIAHSTREYLRLKDDPDMVVYAHEAQRAAGDLIFARMSQLDERTVG